MAAGLQSQPASWRGSRGLPCPSEPVLVYCKCPARSVVATEAAGAQRCRAVLGTLSSSQVSLEAGPRRGGAVSKHASLLPVCHAWASVCAMNPCLVAGPPTEGKGLPEIDGKRLRCQHRFP